MKKLRVFAHQTEANLAKSLLASHGMRAEILGTESGNFSLLVKENDLAEAKRLVDEIMAQDMIFAKPKKRVNHFKKGVLFAIGAPFLVPVVFNYISLMHAYKYWENSHKESNDMLKVAFIVALNIPTYFILKYAMAMFGDMTSAIMGGLPNEGVEL